MIKEPLVSIIIPVYNVEQYLSECMESVLKQTYTNLEILLVDDGSTDSSPKICDKYASQDFRVKVIHKKNGGPMSACLMGIREAAGEYLAFMDSDDWIDLSMIEELVKETNGSDREIICSNYVIEKKNKAVRITQSLKPGIYEREAIEKEIFPCFLGNEERKIHGSRCMKLISKNLLIHKADRVSLDVSMGEDLFLIFLAVLDAHRIVIVEEGYYYHYRFLENSLVHKYKPHLYEEIGTLYQSLKGLIDNKRMKEEQRKTLLKQLQKEYVFLFFLVLKNELRGCGRDCVSRIKIIVGEAKREKGLENVSVKVRGRANKLLYMIWNSPGTLQILTVRCIIRIFDKL